VGHTLPRLALGGHDDDCGAAAAAKVAARRLGRVERCQKPLRERAARFLERLAHDVPRLGREHVALRSPVLAGCVAGARNAAAARPLRSATRRIEERNLAKMRELVDCAQLVECDLWRSSSCEQLEPAIAVAAIGERLRRDRTDARPRPRNPGARVERLRLHTDAELAGLGVARDDRIRHTANLLRDSHSRGPGRSIRMAETPRELVEEVDRGRSPRTPLLALTGVTVVV